VSQTVLAAREDARPTKLSRPRNFKWIKIDSLSSGRFHPFVYQRVNPGPGTKFFDGVKKLDRVSVDCPCLPVFNGRKWWTELGADSANIRCLP
jgi:hypothetical protein